jgi:flagellar motor switch protein FliM
MFKSMRNTMTGLNTIRETEAEGMASRPIRPFLAELLKSKYSFAKRPKVGILTSEQSQVLEQLMTSCALGMQRALQELGQSPLRVTALFPKEIIASDSPANLGEGVFCSFATTGPSALALLRLDETLALRLVDGLLGGSGEPVDFPRPLTQLETQILADGIADLLQAFAQAWSRLSSFIPRLQATTSGRPALLGESAWSLQLPFSVAFGDREAAFDFLLPQPACENLLSCLRLEHWSAEQMAEKVAAQTDILRTLNDVSLPLRAIIGKARLSLSDVARINVGDIICLDEQESDELLLYAGEKETLRARMITLGGRLAVQVAEAIRPGGL